MKIPTLILSLFSLLLQGGGQSVVIPIQNASFEQLPADFNPAGPQNCGPIGYGHVQGWSYQWVFQPLNPNPCGIALPPSGTTVAYAGYGSSFSQDLGVSPASLQNVSHPGYPIEGIYTLTFSAANYLVNYPAYYEVELSFGTQELCSVDGWGTRNFTQVTVICPSPGYLVIGKALPDGGPVQGQQNLVITFSVPRGWPAMFDDASLTFTPN